MPVSKTILTISYALLSSLLFCSNQHLAAQKLTLFAKAQQHFGTNKTDFGIAPRTDGIYANQNAIGGGKDILLGSGYFFSDLFGLDLSLCYHYGDEITALQADISTSTDPIKYLLKNKSDFAYISPSFIAHVPIAKKWKFHIKSGLVLPIYMNSRQEHSLNESSATYEVKSQFNFGFNGMIGLTYQVSDKLGIIFEVEEFNITSKFTKATLVSKQNDLFGFPNTITYQNEVPDDEYLLISEQQLAYPTPFNNVGFNIGIQYNLKN